jgi:hypothetical protein
MSKLARRVILRANYELKKVSRRPFARFLSPFRQEEQQPVIIHCCYHKIGTVWFGRILREVAAHFGLSFGSGHNFATISDFEDNRSSDIFLDLGSHVRLTQLGEYKGSHLIRDPRDMIVSGYFYHLWTAESWANLPRAEFRGRSYKEYLNSLNVDEGLAQEIHRVNFWVPHMADWDYSNPRIYEMRYEDLIRDEQRHFAEMFRHYGFTDTAVSKSCRIAERYSFKKMAGGKPAQSDSKSHLRSGKAGDWRNHFKQSHKDLFKELYPGVLRTLGYEPNDDW